jgi:sentrin-specific protease 1
MQCNVNVQCYRYTKALLRYLNDDSVDKRKHPIDTEEWTLDATGRDGAPQQENGFDCGMFATMYADFISDDLPFKFKQQDIADYRRKAVAAILRGELNYPVD